MTRIINRSRSTLLRAALVALALGGVVPVLAQGASKDKTPMTDTTAPKGFRTHCVGRYLVDLPETADIRFFTADYDWMRMSVRSATRESYLSEVKTFEERLKTTRHEKDPSLLRQAHKDRDDNAVAFVYWEKPNSGYINQVQGFRWSGGSELLAHGEVDDDKADVGLKDTLKALAAFRPRTPNEIPAEPGFCIEGGYFAGTPEANQETASIRLTLKDHPDLWIDIETDTIGKEQVIDGGLLARIDKGMSVPMSAEITALFARVRTLRRGPHPVGPVKAEELLQTMPNKTGRMAHQFTWEAFGERAQTLAPSIRVEFETGKNKTGDEYSGQPSLTDAEAIALFDTIVNSIRLRPTAPAKTSSAEPPPTPLGELAATGRACPQTGLWRSEEGEERVVQAGEAMPRTVVTATPSLWQKLRGDAEQAKIATVWTLVAYSDQTTGNAVANDAHGATTTGDKA
ncbi:T6SS immunity protein Tli4 family protein [Niveibacterium sp.]|uniref:T6SS immunity protein Tli4 family protein n=1 Tax=Niveibacterium sp. TaxID=2017444 RepID=UPI0035AFBD4C